MSTLAIDVGGTKFSVAVFEGKLYFSVDFPRTQLWVTDGTAGGTRIVANVGSDAGLATANISLSVGTNMIRLPIGSNPMQVKREGRP